MNKDPYGRIARWYDRLMRSQTAGLHAIGIRLYRPRAGESVLDVGCGTGSQLSWYQKAGCQLAGIDPSPAMLAVAKEKLAPEADLRLGDAAQLPFDDGVFDLVTVSLMIHELPPAARDVVIGEIKRVLKEDGRILFIDFHPGPIKFYEGWLNKVVIIVFELGAGWNHFRNHLHFLGHNGLIALAAAHQLSIKRERIVGGGTMAVMLMAKDSETAAGLGS